MNNSSFNAVYAMGAIAETLLAAPGSATCVIDGDQSIVSSCIAHILENVNVEHCVGHVINSALQCHHDNYHCCTKSLLVMTSLWLREMDSLVQQGVPLDVVVEGFHQAVNLCVLQLQKSKISIADILNSLEPSQLPCTGCSKSDNLLCDITSDTLHSRDNLPGHQMLQIGTVDAVDDNKKSNVSPSSQRDTGDDNDAVSWYFDDLDLGDHGLEMLINAAGDMERELLYLADIEATSLRETSGHVIHSGGSGDGLAAMAVGIPFSTALAIPGEDNAIQPDIMSHCAENTVLEANVMTDTDTLLDNDKQAKFVSIMQELARTSKLLADCKKMVSDAKASDITGTISNGSFGDHTTERSFDGAMSTSDAGSILSSNCESIVHTFQRTIHCKQLQPDSTCASKHGSEVPESVYTQDSVCKTDTSCKCNTTRGSCESHRPDTNVSQHIDDEFSSCFDDVEFIVNDTKSSKQLFHTEPPHSGRYPTSAGLPILDDARDGTGLGKSMKLNNGFEGEQEKRNCDTSSDLFGGGRQFSTPQHVHSDISAQESYWNGNAISLKSSRHFQNTSCALLDDALLHVTPLSHGHSHSATLTDCCLDESTPCDISSKCQRENVSNTNGIHSKADLASKMHKFTRCLSKGCDDVLGAVAETLVRQLNSDGSSPEVLRFDISRVHTVASVGPMRCDVNDGLVIETTLDQLSLLSTNVQPTRVLLVNGDVSLEYHHQGFTEKTKTRVVATVLKVDTRNDTWLDGIARVLSELDVNGVMVRGCLSEEFREMCHARRIVVFERVTYKVLQAVSESCLVEPTIYVNEATEDNVADDIIIRPWSCDWMDHLLTPVVYALVQPGLSLVQTVMISHPCGSVARMKEEKFWHCANRLHNMLVDGAALTGGGATEQACAAMLQCAKSRVSEDENMFTPMIHERVAAALETFAQLVQQNSTFGASDISLDTGQTEDTTIYDSLNAKVNAWRTAEYLVGVVMTADMEVVTGVDKHFVRAHGGDILCHV